MTFQEARKEWEKHLKSPIPSIILKPIPKELADLLPKIPLYPTGKKDGNKLGKRKRALLKSVALYVASENLLYCHENQMEAIANGFKNKKFNLTTVIKIPEKEMWLPPPPFPSKAEITKSEFDRLYLGSFHPIPVLSTPPTVKVTI